MFHVVMPFEGTNFHFPPTLLGSWSLTLYYISASTSLPRLGCISLRIGLATTIIYTTLMPTERIISNIYYFPSYTNDIYSFYGLQSVGKSSLSPRGRYSLQIVRIWNFPAFVGKRNKTVSRTPYKCSQCRGTHSCSRVIKYTVGVCVFISSIGSPFLFYNLARNLKTM